MEDGYECPEENDFSDLDEWLCEYVDGTIDPTVRTALEEYMHMNPALARHVERLRETRHLLCRFGCNHKAPRGLQPKLRNRLACEIVHESEPILSKYHIHLATLAALSSFAAVLLIIAATASTSSLDVSSQPAFAPTSLLPSASTTTTPTSQELVPAATPMQSLDKYPGYSRFTNNRTPLIIDNAPLQPRLFPSNATTPIDTLTHLGATSAP